MCGHIYEEIRQSVQILIAIIPIIMGGFYFTDEEQTSTLKQESPNVGIQVGDNCTLTLCPKPTSYCHQAGDGNVIIINIVNHEDSNISIYPGTCFSVLFYDSL